MDRQPTNIPFEHLRLRIPSKLVPSWSADERVLFLPLAWGREIVIKPDGFVGAWAIIKPNDPEWLPLIERKSKEAEFNPLQADQLTLMQQGVVRASKPEVFRITVPEYLREIGVFPMPPGGLYGLREGDGLSLWESAALAYHLSYTLQRKRSL